MEVMERVVNVASAICNDHKHVHHFTESFPAALMSISTRDPWYSNVQTSMNYLC
jgi:hypothetical protein